jgi:hypothetical protein
LFESARKVLAARLMRLEPRLSRPESFVFANAIGGATDPGNWYRREWAKVCKAANLIDEIEITARRGYVPATTSTNCATTQRPDSTNKA